MAALTADRFFLHYAPHSDFERGIFVPYLTQEEAERQAAVDLLGGMDEDFLVQVFRAEYVLPKFGWTAETLEGASELPHLDSGNQRQGRVLTQKQLLAKMPQRKEEVLRELEEAPMKWIREIHDGLHRGEHPPQASVPGNAYTWCTGGTATAGPAALAAATAKTILLILAAASNQPSVVEFSISFDGVTASAVPVLVELVSGTGGTAGTPRAALAAMHQLRGWPAQASQTTAADTYSAEPGTQLVSKKWLISPNGGSQTIQLPLGREPTGVVTATTDAKTWSIRATAPATVNAHAYVEIEE